MTKTTSTSDLSAELFIALQRLNGAIALYRSYYTMAGFIPKTHYSASHVDQKELYSAEQWLSDFFANKTGLIPNFLDMNQCVPQSPEAAAKMLHAFLHGIAVLPALTSRDGNETLELFDALRADIHHAEKSRKLMGTSPIYLSDRQKAIALELIDSVEAHFNTTHNCMQQLFNAYKTP